MQHKHFVRVAQGASVGAVLALVLLIYFAMPPRHLVLLAGAPQTSYADYAAQYQAQLLRHGVTLEIRYPGGSLANLQALRAPSQSALPLTMRAPDLALVPTGLASAEDAAGLQSLGGVGRGALWIFYRSDRELERVADLKGLRISTGAPGSAINASVRAILTEAGVLPSSDELTSAAPRFVQLAEPQAVAALANGSIDALFITGMPQSQAVRAALQVPGVRLLNVAQAAAIALRNKTLSPVVLPRGSLNLRADLPATDVTLLAASSSLLVRQDLHPALQYLMLEVAKTTHREPDVFQRYGEFPAPQARDLPLSPYAERFYRDGRPFLFDVLPFWLAALLDRLVWIGLPVLALLIPALRWALPAYHWFAARPLRQGARALRQLEQELRAAHGADVSSLLEPFESRISHIEQTLHALVLPQGLSAQELELRVLLDYVKRDLRGLSRQRAIKATSTSKAAMAPD